MDTPRTTFRFSDEEAAFAAQMRMRGSPEAEAACELVGFDDFTHAPAATLLHTLVEVGIRAIQAKALEYRYQQLAEYQARDPEYQAWRASRRTRRSRRSHGEQGAA